MSNERKQFWTPERRARLLQLLNTRIWVLLEPVLGLVLLAAALLIGVAMGRHECAAGPDVEINHMRKDISDYQRDRALQAPTQQPGAQPRMARH